MSSYDYASEPQAAPVGGKKKKYRDENEEADASDHLNLMQDPRVKRGNTYAAEVMTSSTKKDNARKKPSRRSMGRGPGTTRRSSTPPPVEGRVHSDMQTEEFLEELTDRPVEFDAGTQTLAFMDRPKSPLFVPAKIGQDMDTQIMPGDLFNFDLEVDPILEVLVGKTIHVAMLELMQEEELEGIRLQQEEFESIRNVELSEVQRLEAEARRKADERDRRVAQEKQRQVDRKALEEKVAARAFANQYLSSLHEGVFDDLQEEGFFFDPVRKEVEDIFMPDLLSTISSRSNAYGAARVMMDELIAGARVLSRVFGADSQRLRKELADRLAAEAAAKKAEEEEAARLAAEAAAAADAAGEGEEE